MTSDPSRRSILSWAIVGLGAIFSAILGFPILCYVLDPRNRKGPPSSFKLVEGVKLDELTVGGVPKQGVVRDTRTDGWTLYPNDVIGRVWVVQIGPTPVDRSNLTQAQKDAYLRVFTTICPHLGCAVNLNNAQNGFACPCHAATFKLDGDRQDAANPAKRGMDTLDWEIDPTDSQLNRINVKYLKFEALNEKKVTLGGST